MENFVQRSIGDWEFRIGEQIRQLRISEDLVQADLAKRANVSIGALKNLENGRGSSLQTLIRVIRALKKTEWLDALHYTPSINPLHYLKYKRPVKQRVGGTRKSNLPKE